MNSLVGNIINMTEDSVFIVPKSSPIPTIVSIGRDQLTMIHFSNDNKYSFQHNIGKKVNESFHLRDTLGIHMKKDGPFNAIYSLAFPGWGNYKVKQVDTPLWVKGIAAYGFLGAAIICKFKSDAVYKNYLIESDKNLYTRANNFHHLFLIFSAAGAAIWIEDIVNVFIKGLDNRHNHSSPVKAMDSGLGIYFGRGDEIGIRWEL
ncbi:MAG: hypothetical protein AB9842_14700 [Bacteroidales bacterium]